MITIIARLNAQKGKGKELEDALKSMFPKVETEEGTLSYTLHRAENEEEKFLFYEKYTNKKAFEAHLSAPYTQELLKRFGSLLTSDPTIEYYEEIATIGGSS